MRERPLCAVCLVFLCIIGIFVKVGVITGIPEDAAFAEAAGSEEDLILSGTVYRKEIKETYQLLYLKKIQLRGKDSPGQYINCSIKSCILYDKTFKDIPLGREIRSKGTVKLFEEAGNPGNFEQDFYYRKQGIRFRFQAKELALTAKKQTPEGRVLTVLINVREAWQEILAEGAGKENGAVLSAVLTGEKSEMSRETKELYQKNGIGHILAISGLHVSFIGLGLYRLLRKAGCSFIVSGVTGTIILVLYMAMTGNSVSVVRAVLMLAMRTGADIAGRTYDLPTSLAAAAAVTAVWRPLYLIDAAFLLSYGAVLGILVMTPVMKMLYRGKRKWCRAFLDGLGIQLFLMPVVLYFYYEIPPYSVFLNLIVIPLLSVVMGSAIAGSAVSALGKVLPFAAADRLGGGIGKLLLAGCGAVLKLYQALGELCMKLPGARIVCGRPRMWKIAVCYGMLLGLYAYSKRSESCAHRLRQICGCITVMSAAAVLVIRNEPGKEELRITVLDVGQGDSIFIRMPSGRNILVDGGSSDVKQAGNYRIEPFLLSEGAGVLDEVFISHGDADHCSAVEELLLHQKYGVRIRNLVLPPLWREQETLWKLAQCAKENGVRVSEIRTGMELSERHGVRKEDSIRLRCISPEAEAGELNANESSMVLELVYGEFCMLLTGDTEGKGEELLCASGNLKHCTVLKAAHHGSENSSQEAFLMQTTPDIAVISAGKGNVYGHPHPELLERLQEKNVLIYRTDEGGAVMMRTDGKRLKIRSFRN